MTKSLKDEIVELKENNHVLEVRLEKHALRGDYDPRNTKIIHFEHNPFSLEVEQNTKKMDELIDENMKLKEVDELIN